MSELLLLRSFAGEWTGLHRAWPSPTGPSERSSSQAVVLISSKLVALAVALRWASRGKDCTAVLILRTTPADHQFVGKWSGSHPQLPANMVLHGSANNYRRIVLHGEDDHRPWEVTLTRGPQEMALTVYDLGTTRPELPVVHASYRHRIGSVPHSTTWKLGLPRNGGEW